MEEVYQITNRRKSTMIPLGTSTMARGGEDTSNGLIQMGFLGDLRRGGWGRSIGALNDYQREPSAAVLYSALVLVPVTVREAVE